VFIRGGRPKSLLQKKNKEANAHLIFIYNLKSKRSKDIFGRSS